MAIPRQRRRQSCPYKGTFANHGCQGEHVAPGVLAACSGVGVQLLSFRILYEIYPTCSQPRTTASEEGTKSVKPQSEVEAMSDEHLKGELERLRKENEALKKGASSSVRMKVSEKGALSIYGMGRFPVTLYKEQWLKLLDMSDDIRSFIATHEPELKAKD